VLSHGRIAMSWTLRSLTLVLSLCAGVALVGDVCFAHGYRIKSLEILHPAIAVPKPGSSETCAYVTIVNHGKVAERLRGLRTPVSDKSQIIRLSDDGLSQPEFSEIVIRPGEKLNLRQAGWCLLLTGLKVQLEADVGAYPGTLIFDQTGEVHVEFMCDEYSH
jgi:copper(I)-binding protein